MGGEEATKKEQLLTKLLFMNYPTSRGGFLLPTVKVKFRRYHDEIKDNFCLKNNIPLLRIPYIYDADDDKEEIEKIIKDFIENNAIPQKIIDFYESENRNSYIELLSKMNS